MGANILQTVQAGRGLAAISVAAFHLSILLGSSRYLGTPVLQSVTWRGNLGVDFFFVLSGFIIMFAHQADIGQPERWRGYALKRFVRPFPIYWLCTIAYVAYVLLRGGATSLPQTAAEWVSTATLIRFANFEPPLHVAWTLFHEIGFYAAFSLLIIRPRWAAVVAIAWATATIALFQYAPVGHRTAVATYFSAYNFDFLIGIGAYLLCRHMRRALVLGSGVAGFGLLAATLVAEAHGAAWVALPLMYALGFGGILVGCVALEPIRPLPLASLLGNASYSIYLSHETLEAFWARAALRLDQLVHLGPYGIYGLALAASVTSGCLIYLAVEKPLLGALRGLIAAREGQTRSPVTMIDALARSAFPMQRQRTSP